MGLGGVLETELSGISVTRLSMDVADLLEEEACAKVVALAVNVMQFDRAECVVVGVYTRVWVARYPTAKPSARPTTRAITHFLNRYPEQQ